jgi:hypothetical protein
MAPWHQGWQSSIAAAVVLVLLVAVFIAGVTAVALASKYMPP